jgi:putative ABC transport system permease protein
MVKVALKNILGHKVRVLLTALAVIAGVAFMAGTFVLTDTIKKGFDNLFQDANQGVDAVVRQKAAFDLGNGASFSGGQRDEVPLDLLPKIEAVDGVQSADASVQGFAFIINAKGKPLTNPGGAPQFGSNWPSSEDMNPYELVAGKPPAGPREAVIDKGSADKGHFGVGDTFRVQTQLGTLSLKVAGIATFSGSDNQLGASYVLMDLESAARSFGQEGKASQLLAHAEPGVSQEQLVRNIGAVLPKGIEAITGSSSTQEAQDDLEQGISQFNVILGVFALVSLVAGAFLIYNIFGIVVAQRTRELAMLRALGASRRQIRWAVLIEAIVTGLVASVAGLFAGIGLALLLIAALAAIGLDLPSIVPVIAVRTVIVSVVVGLVVTVVSAFFPAWRASRVAPMAAIRDVAFETGGRSKVRWIIGGAFLVLGALSLISGAAASTGPRVLLGVVGLFIGVVIVGPRIAAPITRAIGAWIPKVRGLTGKMARENAMRNPKRTSATSAAIVLTLMLISVITIFFFSFTASINAAVVKGLKADLEVDSQSFGFGGLSPTLAERLGALPEVAHVASVRQGFALTPGSTEGTTVWGTNGPEFAKLLDIGVQKGSMADLTGNDTVALSVDEAKSQHKPVGSSVTLRFPNGQSKPFRVVATYADDGLIGQGSAADYLLSIGAFEANQPNQQQTDQRVMVKAADGVSLEQLRPAVEKVADAYPTAKVQDVDQIQKSQTKFFTQILSFVLVLLALSVLIGFLGIAITLALSVLERTRELGLLRAVGMNRSQVRSMVRWESVLIAMLGTFLGIALGIVGGSALSLTLREDIDTARIDLPIAWLVAFCLVSALFGVLAAIFPAWRASRLDVLDAVTTE